MQFSCFFQTGKVTFLKGFSDFKRRSVMHTTTGTVAGPGPCKLICKLYNFSKKEAAFSCAGERKSETSY